MDANTVALVSVGGTILVSLISIGFPVFFDWKKSERERKDAERKDIGQAFDDLLKELTPFRHKEIDDIKKSGGDRELVELYSALQARFYPWERLVWPKLNSRNKERVRQLRTVFETIHTPEEFKKKFTDMCDEIVSLTHVALESV